MTTIFILSESYLTDLRGKKQHPPGVDVMPVTVQVANKAAVGQVLHHQTHTEATCEQANIKHQNHLRLFVV